MRTRWLGPLAGLMAISLVACGETTAPPIEGTFQAVVSGEFSFELEGAAAFGIFPGEGFGLNMQPTTAGQLLGIGHTVEARPEVGTFTLAGLEAETFFGVYIVQTAQGTATLTSQSGELVISESTAERLSGSFEFIARGQVAGDPTQEREVFVSGMFSASCAPGARCD